MSAVQDRLDTEEFYRPTANKFKKNRLLVRAEIGKGKRCTIPLPRKDFVYGHVNERTEEGAGEVVMNWVPFQPNPNDVPELDFVAMNRAATMAGCVNNTDVINFRKGTQIRKNIGTNAKPRPKGLSYSEVKTIEKRCHGRKTEQNREPMSMFIGNGFHKEWLSEQQQKLQSPAVEAVPDKSSGSAGMLPPWRLSDTYAGPKKRMPPRHTNASRSHAKMAHMKLDGRNGEDASTQSKRYAHIKSGLDTGASVSTFAPEVHTDVRARWKRKWLSARVLAVNKNGSYNVRFHTDSKYATVRQVRPLRRRS